MRFTSLQRAALYLLSRPVLLKWVRLVIGSGVLVDYFVGTLWRNACYVYSCRYHSDLGTDIQKKFKNFHGKNGKNCFCFVSLIKAEIFSFIA
jgi:hypothetical protein